MLALGKMLRALWLGLDKNISRDPGCVVWTLHDMWAFYDAVDAMVIPSRPRQDKLPNKDV